jgi:hypothetical protein
MANLNQILNSYLLYSRLCYRTTRTCPPELLGWSVFLTGLAVDLKNEFQSYFPNFSYEGGVLSKNETQLGDFGASEDDESYETVDALSNLNPTNRRGSPSRTRALFVEPLMLSTVTRYLNRLDKMGFTIVGSVIDSSVENNCNKKCYVWTLQKPTDTEA